MNKRKGKKIPQGVIELSTSGKMIETRANSITLNSSIEQRVVVGYTGGIGLFILQRY